MIRDSEENSLRTRRWDEERQQLIRERHALEVKSKESERTFKEYQQECRRREQQLLQDLERAYHNHKGINNLTQNKPPESTNSNSNSKNSLDSRSTLGNLNNNCKNQK
jgi:hypothetical protein